MTLSSLKILVLGDIMLDRYQIGKSTKLSPEAPVPVVLIKDYFDRLGGAANVALNINALGASASLCSLFANDSSGLRISELLSINNINAFVYPLLSTTTTKTRILSRAHHLLRIDNEEYVNCDTALTFSELPILSELIADTDIVLLSDYNKGCLHYVENIISLCISMGKTVIVDPKLKDLSRYRDVYLMSPNLMEFQAYVGICSNDHELLKAAVDVRSSLSLKYLVVTLGDRGLLLVAENEHHFIPTYAREVLDVTGAGDTFVATLACFLGVGFDILKSCRLANIAAGLSVSSIGTTSITFEQIIESPEAYEFKDLLFTL